MGSLFKVREWCSNRIEDEQGFDCNSLAVCNIDNAADGEDKIIVGSLGGILRLYKSQTDVSNRPDHELLIEADLGLPILAVSSGRLLPSSDSLHLLILHPRKVSVYSVSGTAGLSEHGCSYNILLIYEHSLQHSAHGVVVGPFGQVKGKDFICIQSLDGALSFFEKETFTFRRFLPNHLLPGPLDYCSATDSFIVATSSRTIESYRYQIIAIAKDTDSTRDAEGASRGRKVVADWIQSLGETVIDIRVVPHEKRSHSIVALGERNLFVCKEDGSLLFTKKFDFSPVSMCPFMNGETLMTLIATEFRTLLCFAHQSLKWAAQMSFTAIALRRAQIYGISGVIVGLSDSGDLSSCYLGTNPSQNLVSVSNGNQKINYEEAEKELQDLRKVIRSFDDDAPTASTITAKLPKSQTSQVHIEFNEATLLEAESQDNEFHVEDGAKGSIFKITLTSGSSICKVRLTVDLPMPLKSSRHVFAVDKIVPDSPRRVFLNVFFDGDYLPTSLTITTTVVFYNQHEAPRVATKSHQLPFKLVAKLAPPPINCDHSMCLDVVSSASVRLKEIFNDLDSAGAADVSSDLGVELVTNGDLVAISGSAKAVQHKLVIKSSSFHSLAFVALELIRRLRSAGVRFDPSVMDKNSLPLPRYFELIDQHLALRQEIVLLTKQLSERAAQFRTTEKRFLVKLKDRNPAPINDIDNLIEFVYSKISETAENLVKSSGKLDAMSSELGTVTSLIVQMVKVGSNMKQEPSNQLSALLSSAVGNGNGMTELSEGWEERTEVGLIDFMGSSDGNVMSSSRFSDFRFSINHDLDPLKDLIAQLIDCAFRGDIGAAKSKTGSAIISAASPPPASMNKTSFLHPTTEIIPEEEEEEEDPGPAAEGTND